MIYFFAHFNNNSNKKNLFNPTQPNPCGLGWVRLDLCDRLSLVEFFLTHHDEFGQKIPLT